MELPNSEKDSNDNVFLPEKNKNKEDFREDKNLLVVSPLQSEKVTIIVKPHILEDRESLKSKVGEVLVSVKENASNIVDKVIKVEEQNINSFKRDIESVSQPQQQSIEEFVIPVVAENYSFSKKILSEDINIEKRWEEKDEIKIPVRYEKLFVNDKEIEVYSKQGIISQIKEKISDLVHAGEDSGDDGETKENEDNNKIQNEYNKDIENQKRKEPQLEGERVPLFDVQQTENSNGQLSQGNNTNKLTNNKYQTSIPLFAEEITISKKIVKVGEVVISKRRLVEIENVDVDTIKERINIEHADGRKEKITDY